MRTFDLWHFRSVLSRVSHGIDQSHVKVIVTLKDTEQEFVVTEIRDGSRNGVLYLVVEPRQP